MFYYFTSKMKDLRKEKQKSSPIKGLEIRNGDIFLEEPINDGQVHFSRSR